MNLLLKNLTDKETRTAQFKTVIALNLNGEQHLFTGIAKGEITLKKLVIKVWLRSHIPT
jgi:XTP/dITP diphosphohydrolase